MTERLTVVAIRRAGMIHHSRARSHSDLRRELGASSMAALKTIPGDEDGFLTTTGRFLTRDESRLVAIKSGQIHKSWSAATRPLLSSDIRWEASS